MNQKINAKVLVVDDEKTVRDFLLRLFKFEAIEAKAVEGGAQAIEAVRLEKFDIVFMDIRMPDIDGIRAYSELKRIDPELQCVFMTGYALEQDLLDKIQEPSVICLKKPFQDITEIRRIARDIIANKKSGAGRPQGLLDKRAYSRLNIPLEVEIKIKDSPGGLFVSLTQDISAGGLKISLNNQLAVGIILELNIHGPEHRNVCKAIAEVVWCKKRVDNPSLYAVGVKFNEINLAELTALLLKYGGI